MQTQNPLNLSDITARYVRGENVHAIAQSLGVSAQVILESLQSVYENLKAAVPLRFNDNMIVQLTKIDQAENEAWKAWELSKQPKIKKESRATKGRRGTAENTEGVENTPDTMQQIQSSEIREGNPVYLNAVIKCVEMRVKLLRL